MSWRKASVKSAQRRKKRSRRITANLSTIDNVILQGMFSEDDKAVRNGVRDQDDLDDQTYDQLRDVRYIIDFILPDIEKQIIIYTYDYNKKQEDIGRILEISQEMVHYYKRRAITRIGFLYWLRKIDIQDMHDTLGLYVTQKQLKAMMSYFELHNQSEVAKRLGINQSAVSSRINLGVERLKKVIEKDEDNEKAQRYLEVFQKLLSNNSLYTIQVKKERIKDPNSIIRN